MNKQYKIAEKALKVIISCDSLKYVPMMDKYIDLAVKQILKRQTAENYQYAEKVLIAGHYKVFDLIKRRELETFKL